MSAPRFDDGVKYKIPGALYIECMIGIGYPAGYVSKLSGCVWISGDTILMMIGILKSNGNEVLSNDLYNAVLPPPPELEELP